MAYFDSFGVDDIPKEIKKIINNKNIIASIFRIQANDSVMCGYFCIGFINFMFKGNSLTDFTPNIHPNLNDQQQFRLNKINEIKAYFVPKIKEGK